MVTPSATRDFATYGAYITSAPTSTQICAHFYMAIDDVTSDNLGVARLDLFNSGSYLNYYYLLRSEFSAANVTQVFRVCGTTPSSGINLEARVYSVGWATLTIYKVDFTDCAFPNGIVRSYYPPDQSHSCGSLWNNRAWAGSPCNNFLSWGMSAYDLVAGQSYQVTVTLMMS